MNNMKHLLRQPPLRALIIGLAAFALTSYSLKATPYASGCTNYSGDKNGDIGFFLNEAADTVTVIYDDGTTNANFDGITTGLNVPRGSNYFNLAGHNGYQIRVFKVGGGSPVKISSDTDSNSIWANIRGVAVNKNPKIGAEFGRIYAGSTGPGGYGWGTPGFKGRGIYALNADFTTALGQGTNSYAASVFPGGPWRMYVAPAGSGLDNKLLVNDFNTPTAALWMFSPDLSSFQPLLKGTNQADGLAAQTHSDSMWDMCLSGSLANGDLKVWITEADWAIPTTIAEWGPNTGSGMYNDVLRFDVGAGPIPADGWSGPPNWAYTVGLEGIANLRPCAVEIGKDGNIICGFGRANGSNPNMQILDPTGFNFLYLGGVPQPYFSQNSGGLSGIDPWNGRLGVGAQVGTYAGMRVSPDGKYIVAMDLNNGLTLANMVGGIPDESTIFNVPNTPTTGNARGVDWDAAGNLYTASSGQLLLRSFSLGGTATCVTSNDWTGTNGMFVLAPPPLIAKLEATQPNASQNYINNTTPGTPIPGVVRISLNTNFLAGPITVSFTRLGTATYRNPPGQTMYTINTGTSPYNVTIDTNSVTFPSGAFTGPGNFFVDVQVTPTAFPLSTNTTTVLFGLSNPSAYQFGNPSKGTVLIQNTGPQLLILSAVTDNTTMYRGVTNDYAKFAITRYGDTNGPGNSPGNVNPVAYTVTNVSYYGTAVYPTDYRARAQRADPLQDGKIQPPVDGPTAIVIYPGDQQVTCIVGNPVAHTNFNAIPADLSLVINLTNAVSGSGSTNGLTTDEGFTYNVGTAQTTLTLIDNTVGPEVVIWSDSMTNAANSVNYTLTYAGTNFGVGGMPVVFPNYVNNQGSILGGSTNDFQVQFGADITTNFYYTAAQPGGAAIPVPPSPVMLVSNWAPKALRMTVNKQQSTICGVNVFPHQVFGGNYALRFNMFLSLWKEYVDTPTISQNFREYATFGMNHTGTNCMWRPSTTMINGTGMFPTNSDGQWFAVDNGYLGITPADYESYTPGPLPNNANAYGGGLVGRLSSSASYSPQKGIFKHPPYVTSGISEATRTVANPGGGQAINKWVDVSVEITEQTNQLWTINRSRMFAGSGAQALTNGWGYEYSYTNGTIMLGYLDPDRNVSDSSAYVLFSNVRVIELSPYITLQPTLTNNGKISIIVTQGASLTLTSAVAYATAPITNVWYRGTGTVTNPAFGNPTAAIATNIANANSMETTLTLNNVAQVNGTNYISVFSDVAGSVTSRVAAVTVAMKPTSQVVLEGATAALTEVVAGPVAATGFQWRTNDVNLVNSTHYSTVTAATMRITNAQPADAGTYTVQVTHPDGVVTQSVTLTTVGLLTPTTQTNLVGTTFTMNAPTITGPVTTYRWRKGASNLTNGGRISGADTATLTITDLQLADAGDYNLQVINGATLTTRSNKLSVLTPQFSNIQVAGGNTVLTFYSPNTLLDTTNAWTLQSSAIVTGPYVNTPANYTITSGIVQVTVPASGPTMFYRLIH